MNITETTDPRPIGENATLPTEAPSVSEENAGAESASVQRETPAAPSEPTAAEQIREEGNAKEANEAVRAAHIAEGFRFHFAELERQAQTLRRTFPQFDLRAELRNPVFARMTAPGVGIGVEDAYYAVHRKELQASAMREASDKTAEMLASAIRSGSRRPIESGASAQAPSVSAFDYAKASREQRESFKKDLRARIARGEKVYPK